MLNYIWAFIILISIICSAITGRIDILSKSILTGAEESISIIISMLGMMALWTGLMKIAESSGLIRKISTCLKPLLNFLFPEYPTNSPASNAICMNIIANFLGLGNAATPFGVIAMKEMNKQNTQPSIINNSMAIFVVINTASLQLIPTFLSILRQNHGSKDPFSILPELWLTSLISLIIGISTAKIFERICK